MVLLNRNCKTKLLFLISVYYLIQNKGKKDTELKKVKVEYTLKPCYSSRIFTSESCSRFTNKKTFNIFVKFHACW